MKSIVVCGLDEADREVIRLAFPGGVQIVAAQTPDALLQDADRLRPELGFLALEAVVGGDGRLHPAAYLDEVQSRWNGATTGHLIIVTAPALLREAVKAVQAGASNYLTTPIDVAELRYVTESLRELETLQHELQYLRGRVLQTAAPEVASSRSPAMQETLDQIRRVAPSTTTVLLTGETGVGKSTLAQLLHQHSTRADGPFIVVHCGTVHDNLIESELFGHEKGAFTGAVRRKLGRFEIARGGTIFLDDIAVLTPSAQVKLLHVIQERTIQRVGGDKPIHVDVRLIAATNADLKGECEEGRFRWDLYYRLSVFPIHIPPLRERVEDIPAIVHGILARLQRSDPRDIAGLDPAVVQALAGYPWPGNVRELENLIERAFILETSDRLSPDSFPAELMGAQACPGPAAVDTSLSLAAFREAHLLRLERRYLVALLEERGGRLAEVADAAGVGLRQLHKLMARHRLHRRDHPGS